MELFKQIELKFNNIETKLEEKITAANSSANQQLCLLEVKYDIAKLEQKYSNELNEQREEWLNQISSNMKLELDKVNEIVALDDANEVESSLERINKAHSLKFKVNKINPKEAWIQKLIKKEFKFKRIFQIFSALHLVKYKNILGLQNYIKMNFHAFNEVKFNNSYLEAVGNENLNLETLMLFVEAGEDVNAKDEWESTASIWASLYGHFEIVRYLVENGANVNAKNNYNNAALIFASDYGHLEIVKCLIENGAEVNAKNKKK